MTDDEFAEYLNSAVDDLQEKQDELLASHGLGSYARFWFDQAQESLDFSDNAGATGLRALVIPIGSWSHKSNSWKWAWANESILPHLREKSLSLKGLAAITGFPLFQRELFDAAESMAWELTAIAVRHLGATGAYRAPGEGSNLFLAIMELQQVGLQGWTS